MADLREGTYEPTPNEHAVEMTVAQPTRPGDVLDDGRRTWGVVVRQDERDTYPAGERLVVLQRGRVFFMGRMRHVDFLSRLAN